MDRNRVFVDGTRSGPACSSRAADQSFRRGKEGNGIVVLKAGGVTIENLTACNFLGQGNQIWWNGGDGSGRIGMGPWSGSHLSATTTYFSAKRPQASYGIFISNARGPGALSDSYASNMWDSGFYVGACNPCNATLERLHGEHSNDGYSGTNSAGVVLRSSEFNDNTEGITTNSQNNDDAPSPQLGSTFTGNHVHDNNNANAASTPRSFRAVGSGIIVAGGRHNVITGNLVERNGAWGILLVPFIDVGKPPPVAHCQGGSATKNADGTTTCFFDDWANQVSGNTLSGNGFFGNPANGDLADVSGRNTPGNCWHDNVRADASAVTAEPADLQSAHADCAAPGQGADLTSELANQVLCDTEILSKCAADATHRYPRKTQVVLKALPRERSMPNPCAGVPANPWCRR
jgi:hypothetical protein